MSKRAVIYARFSSDNQREESISAQIRACQEYAEKNGYFVTGSYVDEAKSALTDDRPSFLKMIRDVKNGSLITDVVLVHKLDRFSRNRYDSAFYKRELRLSGVRVESVLERLDDSPESVLLESLIEGMAEYYSKNLSREVMKGLIENALQCKHTGGKPPLGYGVNQERKYYIIEKEADIVRLIFNMYNQGSSYHDILRKLQGHGYKTKLGRPFGKNSIHDILGNKKYAGFYVFNRCASKSIDGKRNNHKSKDPKDIIEIPDGIPAIISKDLFFKTQELLAKNKQLQIRNSKSGVEYLLSGITSCSKCGHRMIGSSSNYYTRVSREYRQQYHYRCGNASRTGECDMPKIKKNLIEGYVLSELEKCILSEEVIPLLAEKIFQFYEQELSNDGKNVPLEKDIQVIDGKIENLVQALSEGSSTIKALVNKIEELEMQKNALEISLQEWVSRQNTIKITKEQVLNYLLHNHKQILKKDPLTTKLVVKEFVEKVIVNTDTIEIYFKVTVLNNGGGGGKLIVSKAL